MPFNSYSFLLVFLPIVLLIYFSLNRYNRFNYSKYVLLISSLVFYGYYVPWNLPVLCSSILVNYFIGMKMLNVTDKSNLRLLFYSGLLVNLGALFLFKYSNIGISNLIAPIGISFFTLQQVAFLVDSYQGLGKKRSLIDYSLFVSFFPHLLAGPIVQHKDMIPQYEKIDNKKFNPENFSFGIYLFCIGLAKKVLISDYFSEIANVGYNDQEVLSFFLAWKTSLSYTFQLYFDFSGYSDMAVALGLMFNIKIAQNFNSPLKSTNLIDFWNRWHMTLGAFVRSYLFTPIAKMLPSMSFANIMIATFLSMVVVGIWHGAGMTFLLYGALHGLGLVVNHLWKKRKLKMPPFIAWLITFNFINLSFILFRAPNLSVFSNIAKGMIGLNGIVIPKIFGIKNVNGLDSFGFSMGSLLIPSDYLLILSVVLVFYLVKMVKNSNEFLKVFKPNTFTGFCISFIFILCLFGMNRVTEFIYFNF